ncbi:hypothetical protein QFZ22_000293 [Streptomyces canus]|uniref:Uncharacterized protein n=1 Tax=Streptomyces canus TaxID=58343 RepID=A0AAW8F4B4_9ACTN|nr:hypothetical protein [Streptomyces canus]
MLRSQSIVPHRCRLAELEGDAPPVAQSIVQRSTVLVGRQN